MGLWDTNPAAWTASQFVEPSDMTTEVQNRFLAALHLQKGFGFSAGESNAGGGGDTQLTGYDVTLPANLLNQAGSGLIVEGTFVKAATAETSTVKLKVGGGTAVTIISTGGTSDIVPFRMVVRRRTSTTGAITGIAWVGAPSGGAPTNYLANGAAGAVNWTISQTLAIFAASSTAAEMKLTDYHVIIFKGDGALV